MAEEVPLNYAVWTILSKGFWIHRKCLFLSLIEENKTVGRQKKKKKKSTSIHTLAPVKYALLK